MILWQGTCSSCIKEWSEANMSDEEERNGRKEKKERKDTDQGEDACLNKGEEKNKNKNN